MIIFLALLLFLKDYTRAIENDRLCDILSGSYYLHGRCVKFFYFKTANWFDAKNFCETYLYKGRLAEFTTQEEVEEIGKFDANEVWIALTDIVQERLFIWNNSGAVQNNNSGVWNENEPNDDGHNEDCVLMKSQHFNDYICDDYRYFVCEIEVMKDPVVSITDPCYPMGNAVYKNNKCFNLIELKLNRTAAKQLCEVFGAHLYEMITGEDKQILTQYLANRTTNDVWLGGNWSDTTFIWETNCSQINWESPLSNNGGNTNCVILDSNQQLATKSCSLDIENYSVCVKNQIEDPCKSLNGTWRYYNENCFLLSVTTNNWWDAQSICIGQYSHLVEPADSDFENFLQTLLLPEGNIPVWIGGFYDNGTYLWYTTLNKINSTILNKMNETSTLVWNSDLNVRMIEARLKNESHHFVCQTAATKLRVREYVAVPPITGTGSTDSITTSLKLYSSYSNITVYLHITECCLDNNETYLLRTLSPLRSLTYVLQSWVTLGYIDSGVRKRYIRVKSSMPITVVLFITDKVNLDMGSALVLPAQMFENITNMFYLLDTGQEELSELSVTVVSMSAQDTQVGLILSDVEETEEDYTMDNVLMRSEKHILVTLRPKHEELSLHAKVYPVPSYLISNNPVALFVSNMAVNDTKCNNSVDKRDLTLDEIIPLEYAGSSYVSFPLMFNNRVNDKSSYTIFALYDNTNISIISQTNDSYQSIMLHKGESKLLNLPQNQFYHFNGSNSFIISQQLTFIHKGDVNIILRCVTSLVPNHLWAYQYDYYYSDSNVNVVYIIVSVYQVSLIEINGVSAMLNCSDISDGQWAGCTFVLPASVGYYRFRLKYHQSTFGAYMFTYNNHSAACNALGISDQPKKQNEIDFSQYIQNYDVDAGHEVTPPVTCPTPTSTDYPSTTDLGITEDNTTVITSEETTTANCTHVTSFVTSDMTQQASEITTQEASTPDMTPDVTTTEPVPLTTDMKQHAQQLVQEIVKTLSVEKREVLSFMMTKECRKDERPSSNFIGAVGIVIIVLVVGIICLADIITLCHHIVNLIKTSSLFSRNKQVFYYR